ncbi:MAG: glycosyltransferase [Planctomycetota bacterium]
MRRTDRFWPACRPHAARGHRGGGRGLPAARPGPRKRNTIGSRPVQITFLGTLIPIKGPHLLLEAWRRLPAELRTRGELTIAGPTNHAPPYVEGLRAAAEELMVELRGRQNRNQVAELLGKTDLLVMPSQWFENRPLILHEALALGVPCLVSDLGGMAELVRPGIDGWHFPMGDARALANRLAEVLREPEQLARLRPKSPELLGWRAVAEQHIEHYQELLAPKDAPRPDESPL